MRLRYTPRAIRHLNSIADFIAQHNPSAAVQIGARIRTAAALLERFPAIGREGALATTRELIVPGLPYIVVYRVAHDEIAIVGIYHGAQLRPGQSNL